MLTKSERRVLGIYRQYLITPGEMLCFSGPNLKQYEATLDLMSDNNLLDKEVFNGGYSLTNEGYAAMQNCD